MGGGRSNDSGACRTPLARRLLAGVAATTSISADAALRGGDCCSDVCNGDRVLDVGGAEDEDEESERAEDAARGLEGLSDDDADATAAGDDASRAGSERHSSNTSSSDVIEMGERDIGKDAARTRSTSGVHVP